MSEQDAIGMIDDGLINHFNRFVFKDLIYTPAEGIVFIWVLGYLYPAGEGFIWKLIQFLHPPS